MRLKVIVLIILVTLTHNLCLSATPTADTLTVRAADADSLVTATLRQRIDAVLGKEAALLSRTQLGLYVYDLTADSAVYAHNHCQLMRPASCQKIVTAVTALSLLGTDYNLATTLAIRGDYCDPDSTLHGDVYVYGCFDPLFGRDDLRSFVQSLRERNIYRIDGDICLDVSFKDSLKLGYGWCWDDKAHSLAPILYRRNDTFAANFAAALAEAGITVFGTWHNAERPSDVIEICRRTHTIDQVLMTMMKDSDNQFAESMFYQIAARSGKKYASREEAEAQIKRFIQRLGLDPTLYEIADGSGLSLYNYLTPELVVSLLRYAYQHDNIYYHLLPSLPIAGTDGTLKRRMRTSASHDNVRAKTGTLTGVSTLSGYCTAPDGHLLCFSIFNQGLRRTADGRRFQDIICDALTTPLDAPSDEPDAVPIEPEGVPDAPSVLPEAPAKAE